MTRPTRPAIRQPKQLRKDSLKWEFNDGRTDGRRIQQRHWRDRYEFASDRDDHPFFLFRKNAEQEPFPKKCGEDYVPSTSLTTYCQLRKWIRRYNSNLSKEERLKYEVSEDNADIRDTIAHGRLIAPDPPTLPYTMWKFGETVDGRVPVKVCQILTRE